ncbi:MAG: anti-sigma factor domain-containing protein [Acidimicrobiales bacterium]
MELTHTEIEELLGAYALDAVDPQEGDAVELHLRECPRCRAEVAEHREVAASLAQVGSPAPAGLWSRIAEQLEEAPPQLDLARVVAMRPPRRSMPARLAAAMVAAAAVAVLGVVGVQVSRMADRQDQLAAALQRDGLDEAVQAALLDPDARRVALRSEDGATFVQAVVGPGGDAYLVDDNLPRLPSSRTYQLWAITDGGPVSVGVLGADPGVSAARVGRTGVTALAVTAERAGGVAAPTMSPLVTGRLPVA